MMKATRPVLLSTLILCAALVGCQEAPDDNGSATPCTGSSGDIPDIVDGACPDPCPVSASLQTDIELQAKSIADEQCVNAGKTSCNGQYGAVSKSCETFESAGVALCSVTASVIYSGTCI